MGSTGSFDQRNNVRATYSRRAHHAGSWYDSSPAELEETLSTFLRNAFNKKHTEQSSSSTPPRAIIAPHAGYSYSGPTAAFAYLGLKEALERKRIDCIRTIVVLHPSHHVRLDGCAVSGASSIETPLANLPVDDELRAELLSTGHFETMERIVDEQEHSGEMQYPYIAKVLLESSQTPSSSSEDNGAAFSSSGGDGDAKDTASSGETIVRVLPIMVGSIDSSTEAFYGRLLAPILARPHVFTVISSDFCHWGRRFGYFPPHDRDYKRLILAHGGSSSKESHDEKEEIFDYIEKLDRMGMDHIEMQNPGAFAEYLRISRNTICGRHPIAVWLNAVKTNQEKDMECVEVTFVEYAQSGQVTSVHESSVSYASAIARKLVKGDKEGKK